MDSDITFGRAAMVRTCPGGYSAKRPSPKLMPTVTHPTLATSRWSGVLYEEATACLTQPVRMVDDRIRQAFGTRQDGAQD